MRYVFEYDDRAGRTPKPAVYDRIRGVSARAEPIAVCGDPTDAEMIARALNALARSRSNNY
jgi:hypothetical protein